MVGKRVTARTAAQAEIQEPKTFIRVSRDRSTATTLLLSCARHALTIYALSYLAVDLQQFDLTTS